MSCYLPSPHFSLHIILMQVYFGFVSPKRSDSRPAQYISVQYTIATRTFASYIKQIIIRLTDSINCCLGGWSFSNMLFINISIFLATSTWHFWKFLYEKWPRITEDKNICLCRFPNEFPNLNVCLWTSVSCDELDGTLKYTDTPTNVNNIERERAADSVIFTSHLSHSPRC